MKINPFDKLRVNAEQSRSIKNLKLKINGMHCTSCAFNIDGELEDTEGVVEANTNYARAETEVKFDEDKISEDNILKIINSIGYSADPR